MSDHDPRRLLLPLPPKTHLPESSSLPLFCSFLNLSFCVMSICVTTDFLVPVSWFADLALTVFRSSLHSGQCVS
jgi:hypothetical protein